MVDLNFKILSYKEAIMAILPFSHCHWNKIEKCHFFQFYTCSPLSFSGVEGTLKRACPPPTSPMKMHKFRPLNHLHKDKVSQLFLSSAENKFVHYFFRWIKKNSKKQLFLLIKKIYRVIIIFRYSLKSFMFLTISKTKADAYDDDNLISLEQGKIIIQ